MRIGFLDKAYLLVTSQTDEPDPETFNKHTCEDWLQCPYANLKYIYCYWRHNWRQIQRFLPSQTEMMYKTGLSVGDWGYIQEYKVSYGHFGGSCLSARS